MTGAGASDATFVEADGFLSIPGTPTYYRPGHNITVPAFGIDNTLQRLREPVTPEAIDSIKGNFEGALTVEFSVSADVDSNVRNVVFNDGGTGFTSGTPAFSRWFLQADYLNDSNSETTVERELRGCIPLEYSITYQQGTNTIRNRLAMAFADERKNTTRTPSSITGPTLGSDAPFHGMDLTIDSQSYNGKLQRATLTFSQLSRFHRGADPTPDSAVVANPQIDLSMAAIYERNDLLEAAYGTSASTQPQDNITSVSGTFDVNDQSGSTIASYSLSRLKPASYEWSDLVNPDTDLTDPIDYQVTGELSIT